MTHSSLSSSIQGDLALARTIARERDLRHQQLLACERERDYLRRDVAVRDRMTAHRRGPNKGWIADYSIERLMTAILDGADEAHGGRG